MDVKITFDRYNVIEADKINDVKVVMVKGEKGDVGYPTDAQVETAVDEWLTAHPEVTTTVQDGSITEAKLANDVKGMFDEKADAIIKTSSGDIASFSDGGNGLLVKSLIANITPIQSGSGDPSPSNVRPISGVDTVGVVRTGKNLADLSVLDFNDSEYAHSHYPTDSLVQAFFNTLDTLKGQTVVLSRKFTGSASGVAIGQLRIQTNEGVCLFYPNESVTVPNYDFKNAQCVVIYGSTSGASVTDIQLELGTTATAYEPYQGTSYPISLGQTVYGGTLEVMSGKLTIDKGYVDLGSINWSKTTNSTKTYFQTSSEIADMKKSSGINYLQGLMCSGYTEQTWTRTLDYGSTDKAICCGWTNKSYIAIADSTYAGLSASEFKTAMNGVQLVYELATPTEITLTPTQVKTLLGNNNIWADSGTVEVEYRADTTLAYNELVAMILENIGN